MSQVIEFWYEFASTYSYPAAMRIEDLACKQEITVEWKPFLLGPLLREQGFSTSPFNEQPVKGAYMWRDMERTCARLNLEFKRPDPFPQNGLHAARIATAIARNDEKAAFSRAVYLSEFAEGRSIADPDLLAELLARVTDDAAEILEKAASQQNKDLLKKNTSTASNCGFFGAPICRTPDGEIFWGNDRLEEAMDWALRCRES